MSRNRPIPTLDPEDVAFVHTLVIYEDARLMAFDKPSGLAVQTRGNRGRCLDTLLWAFARSNGKRPKLVHRLDAGTSGVIVAAKTKPAAAELSTSFASRRAKKTYLALVSGQVPNKTAGEVTQALLSAKGSRDHPPMIPSDTEGALMAHTHWRILARVGEETGQTAMIELHPKTGRQHQLRAHMKYLGCPILGDPLYGSDRRPDMRLMLHARRLVLPQTDGGDLVIEAPLPDSFREAAMQLGLAVPGRAA